MLIKLSTIVYNYTNNLVFPFRIDNIVNVGILSLLYAKVLHSNVFKSIIQFLP